MKIVDSYLFKQTTIMIFIVLGGIAGLLLVTGVADEAARRVNDSYTLYHAVIYVIATMPAVIQDYLSVIVMLGTLISVASLNKHQELTIIQQTATSSLTLVSRLILPAVILLPFIFVTGQFLAPQAKQWAVSERAQLLGKTEPTLTGEWYRINDSVINIERIVSSTKLVGLTQFTISPSQELERVSYSQRADYIDEQWVATKSRNIDFTPEGVIKSENDTHMLSDQLFTPTMLNSLIRDYEELSLVHLYQQLTFRKQAGTLTPEIELTFWHRLLFPIEFMAMLLISIGMAMGSFRQRTIGDVAFKTLIIGVVSSLMLKTVSSAFALSSLPIALAVVLTNLLFLFGSVFFLKQRL